jgi:hypothetical protein
MYKTDKKFTWLEVVDQWSKHMVPIVTVIEIPNFPEHRHGRWANKDGTNCEFIYGNPVNETGRHLAEGLVTSSADIFAAFAIYSFLIGKSFANLDLKELTMNVVNKIDTRDGWYWRSNVVRVLPTDIGGGELPISRQDWKGQIDEAASTWSQLAAGFAVLRGPSTTNV